jgi:predicted nucleic acid-binding Zn ribbon protein
MATRGKSGPVRIGELIGPILKQAEKDQHRPEALEAVASWPETVGHKLTRVSRAVSLRHGKLFVEVKAPVWKQELLLQKRNILRKINRRLGKNIVSDLVINVRDFIHVQGK